MDDIAARIERGKKAIGLAQERGMDTSEWEAELSKLQTLAEADNVAQRTRELLGTQGWCLWKCDTFGGDTVVICRDELVSVYPAGYPVYTEAELEQLSQDGISKATLRLVHEAKKTAGAIVIGIKDIPKEHDVRQNTSS